MSPKVIRPVPDSDVEIVPTLRDPRYSQSLERGLAILGCFSTEHHVLGIAELAGMLGMSRSTTHRYVITLVALGFMEQCQSRKYRLGLRVNDLGTAALNCTGLRKDSHTFLEELRAKRGFTVSLAVRDGPEILYVDRVRSFRRGQYKIDLNLHLGSRLPAYCTAMGKVLLAGLPDRELTQVLAQMDLTRRGPNTIMTKTALLAVLEQAHDVGMAVNHEELAHGLVSIAVPIRDDNRDVVAAINMAAHTDMISLPELVEQLPHLLATGDHISARLGYQSDDEQAR